MTQYKPEDYIKYRYEKAVQKILYPVILEAGRNLAAISSKPG